jgi:hypothetical protein
MKKEDLRLLAEWFSSPEVLASIILSTNFPREYGTSMFH